MKFNSRYTLLSSLFSSLLLSTFVAEAGLVARFPMEVTGGKIEETVSGARYDVLGNFPPENVAGAVGDALRFDGYTSRVDAALGAILPEGSTQMTLSLWVAVPCYPIIQLDTDTNEKTAIVSCLDDEKKTGFGIFIGFDGKYAFKAYVGGWPVELSVDTPLPVNEWNHLAAVIDCEAKSVKLYNNGAEVGSGRAVGSFSYPGGTFRMGRGSASRMMGPFELMSFNGLIDDVCIYNEALSPETLASMKPENKADLNIPASRFASDLLRPRFHGMPAAGWTNECHGMYHSDGRFHLFFQKNADGPYMARLHWGHISSSNLYDWCEEPIALAPGDWYDIKGCWSGCVFADERITGGKPNILYTAVDYVKAMIAQAAPLSDDLDVWTKSASNPIINGRPGGLSDDFRDPYFFRNGDDAYIIVGSSKNGVGVTTLHRYNEATKAWSNDGDIFFAGRNVATDGKFWEMSNVTPMTDGKWLFTTTPLGTSSGVRSLYWVGSIDAQGHFSPDASSVSPRLVELESKEGFGMLSPTIYRYEGKTIVLGIVPDKLPAADNWRLGWAHCYSLPREWSLSENGTLLQRPYEGLTGLRSGTLFTRDSFSLSNPVSLAPVEGRSAEVLARFIVGSGSFGLDFLKNGDAKATITYSPVSNELTADFSSLPRLVNDAGVYDGIYRCSLPERVAVGSEMKINIFIDHSILDIFVNDKWATSIRLFPTDNEANGIEAFSDTVVEMTELKAWVLEGDSFGSVSPAFSRPDESSSLVNVYDMSGKVLKSKVSRYDALTGLPSDMYIVGADKYHN